MSQFIILGARGTMPACGAEFIKYGGNTTCFAMQNDHGVIIIDAGTGISHLARKIDSLSSIPQLTMLFTHFHLDHVLGLPCFNPLYNSDTTISIMADPRREHDWKDTLVTFMGKPYWPVGLGDTDAIMQLNNIPIDDGDMTIYGTRISWFSIPHPQNCLAFRMETGDKSLVIATDVEYDPDSISEDFINFCAKADYLLFDNHYTPEEYPKRVGWGHSTWKTATAAAERADVGQLILTHHSQSRTDAQIDTIVESARKVFPNTTAAVEDMVLDM